MTTGADEVRVAVVELVVRRLVLSSLHPTGKNTPRPNSSSKLVIEKYRRMIFGRKSEKLARELEQLELRLETTQAADQAAEAAAEAQQPSSPQSESKPKTSRPKRKPLPEDLPREVITRICRSMIRAHVAAENCAR
jgi:hypothetical protein